VPIHLGNWTGLGWNQPGFGVSTWGAPVGLTLGTAANVPGGGSFSIQAAASGTVSFDYSVSGYGSGSFGWFSPTYSGGVSDPDVGPTHVSFTVQAGDTFGFSISCNGFMQAAGRWAQVTDFSAPVVPEPSATVLIGCGMALLTWRTFRRQKGRGEE
jgi:hypothetical protein